MAILSNLPPKYLERLKSRFWAKVDKKVGQNGCWLWTGYLNQDGYGRIWIETRMVMAHRVAYAITNSDVPENLSVCHSCDNPGCVNPEHLWLGSHLENMTDMYQKKRRKAASGKKNGTHTRPDKVRRGEKNNTAKLTPTEVAEIRNLSQQGVSRLQLSQTYKVSIFAIRQIITKKSWQHIL